MNVSARFMRTKSTLMLTVGPWQAVLGSALVRQLKLSAESVDMLLLSADADAPIVGPTRRIHELNEFKDFFLKIYARLGEERALGTGYDLILVPGFGGREVFATAMQFFSSKTRVIIYEDGLHAICDDFFYGRLQAMWRSNFTLRLQEFIRIALKREWSWFTARSRLVGEGRFLDVDSKSFAPSIRLSEELVRDQLDLLGYDKGVPFGEGRNVLVLGTNFSAYGLLRPEEEYRPVYEYIESLGDGVTCWWKPHPRADRLYSELLSFKYPNVRQFPEGLSAYPIEAFVGNMNLVEIASFHSSALLYSHRLYGIPPRVIGEPVEVLQKLPTKDFYYTAVYMEKCIKKWMSQ